VRKSEFFLLTILLTGCVSHPRSYNPESIPESDLATINFEKITFWETGTKFSGSITTAFDRSAQKVIDVAGEEVKIPTGTYVFTAYCTNGSVYSTPRLELAVTKGKTYTLACKNHTEKGFLGLDMNKSVSLELLSESN